MDDKNVEKEDEIPAFTGKDLNAILWLLIKRIGLLEINKEVLDAAPGPDVLKIERQWDAVNGIWRFFIPRKEGKKLSKIFVPKRKNLITGLN